MATPANQMSQNQHYIPVFYLKRWVGNDGQLYVYCRPHNKVNVYKKHPDATGYVEGLYTITGADARTERHLEGQFFRIADNDAAVALGILETGRTAELDLHMRSAWSRFVMSLLHRNPEAVSKLKTQAASAAAQAADEFRKNYATLRQPTDPETYEQYPHKPLEHYAAQAAVLHMQGLMDHKLIGKQLNQMTWDVLPLRSRRSLLTSDRPLVMRHGMALPDFHLVLPIGPGALFIAANDPRFAGVLSQGGPDKLVAAVNDQIVRQARKFVWGRDERQLRFVERRLGEKLPSSILDLPNIDSQESASR